MFVGGRESGKLFYVLRVLCTCKKCEHVNMHFPPRAPKHLFLIVIGCALAYFEPASAFSSSNIRRSLVARARMSKLADATISAATPQKRSARGEISRRSRVVTRSVSERGEEEVVISDTPSNKARVPMTSQPKLARQGFMTQLAASVCMSICVLAIAVVSPFVQDGEGWVASKFPTSLASFLRDNPAAWRTFNAWTWALTAPALAISRPKLLLLALLRGPHEAFDLPYANYVDDGGQGCALDIYHHSLGKSSQNSEVRSNAGASAANESKDNRSNTSLRPTIVFVHGGAWSHGSRQLFALLARRLRDELDCVVVVPGYRTWPRGDMSAQARDVGAAIRWVHAHIGKWGGDKRQIILVGHSSGAHLCATHVLTRGASSCSSSSNSNNSGGDGAHGDVAAFVGLCGVYDINAHYAHEKRRGVHEISAMKPAAGKMSDLVKPSDSQEVAGGERPVERTGDLAPEVITAFASASPTLLATTATGPATLKDRARHFPRTYLYHSADDTTVPLRSTLDFSEALREGWPQAAVDLEVLDLQQARDNANAAPMETSQPEERETRAAMRLSGGHSGVLLDVMLGDHPAPLLLAMLRRALAIS